MAEKFYRQAIKKDSNFALAYAGLAEIYRLFTKYSVSSKQNALEQFKATTMKALEHDDSLADAHNALAFILYKSEWNWLEAENHFRRTIEITPGYTLAHHWSGNL
jgi:Tfp pilus assembly protein PilF